MSTIDGVDVERWMEELRKEEAMAHSHARKITVRNRTDLLARMVRFYRGMEAKRDGTLSPNEARERAGLGPLGRAMLQEVPTRKPEPSTSAQAGHMPSRKPAPLPRAEPDPGTRRAPPDPEPDLSATLRRAAEAFLPPDEPTRTVVSPPTEVHSAPEKPAEPAPFSTGGSDGGGSSFSTGGSSDSGGGFSTGGEV